MSSVVALKTGSGGAEPPRHFLELMDFEPATLRRMLDLAVQTKRGAINGKPLAGADYEVELKIEGRAEIAGASPLFLFGFDLLYAGVFRIQNVPQENLHPLIMIECPRLLFPFARELIATAVRNGGFPPLMIDPVDFVSLYRQKLAEQAPGPATA